MNHNHKSNATTVQMARDITDNCIQHGLNSVTMKQYLANTKTFQQ